MFINRVQPTRRNRFSDINPGRFDKRFFYAHMSDGNGGGTGGGGDEKYTLEEAKAKLKEQKFAVMPQSALDNIINEKYGDGFNKGKAEGLAEAKPDDKLKTDNEKLKQEIAELKKEKPDMIPKAEHEALMANKDKEISDRDGTITTMRGHQKEAALLKLAQNSVNPETLVRLIKDNFQLADDGSIFPVNEKGEKIVVSEGYQTGEAFIADYLKKHTYLAKDPSQPGAGSGTSGGGTPTGGGGKHTLDELADMPMDQYAKAGGIASLSGE